MRLQPGEHLTQAGVDLARRVGTGLGQFDCVYTSEITRTVETAIVMGYAVDGQPPTLGSLLLVDDEMDSREGFGAFACAARRGGEAAVAAQAHAALLRSIARSLPDGGRALLISHGGMIELGVVGVLPDLDYEAWGPACAYCEGVRLRFDRETCLWAQKLPLPRSAAGT